MRNYRVAVIGTVILLAALAVPPGVRAEDPLDGSQPPATSSEPSDGASLEPVEEPSDEPSVGPSHEPTDEPSDEPTVDPSDEPTDTATDDPGETWTPAPTSTIPPDPPSVDALCATANDYLWRIWTNDLDLGRFGEWAEAYEVHYSTQPFPSDWTLSTDLQPGDDVYASVIATARSAGGTLYAGWQGFGDVTTTAANEEQCAPASIALAATVVDGDQDASGVTFLLWSLEPNPPFSERDALEAQAGTTVTVDAGYWLVWVDEETVPAGLFIGDVWCDAPESGPLMWLDPGVRQECTVVLTSEDGGEDDGEVTTVPEAGLTPPPTTASSVPAGSLAWTSLLVAMAATVAFTLSLARTRPARRH